MSEKNKHETDKTTIENKYSSRLESNSVAAREVITRSHTNFRGLFSSPKNNKTIACESLLELQACNVFEFCREVVSYKEQPISIPYYQLGKWRKYTPDFSLTLICGRIVYIEVKPEIKLKNIHLIDHFSAISAILKEDGKDFYIMTEKEINPPYLQTNYHYLKYASRIKINNEELAYVLEWILTQGEVTLGSLSFFVGSEFKAVAFVSHGYLSLDLSNAILPSTVLSITKEDSHETARFSRRSAPTFQAD